MSVWLVVTGGEARAEPPALPVTNGTPDHLAPSYDDWGGAGLMQMPTARFFDEGEFGFTTSYVWPYYRYTVEVTPLPWLETLVRYNQIQNVLYGPVSFSGHQQYKHRSVDAKFRLMEEGDYLPILSLMFRDDEGTALFGSEFLVASKRYYDFDFSGGIAWGYAAHRGNIPNPFAKIISSYAVRPQGTAAGSFRNSFFKGERAALFGGVEWVTPVPDLRVKLEYDANDYTHEPFGNSFPAAIPLNAGVEYRILPFFAVGAAYERGNKVMARATLRTNFDKDLGVPRHDTPPPPVPVRAAAEESVEPPISPRASPPVEGLSRREEERQLTRYGIVAADAQPAGSQLVYRLDASKPVPPRDELARIALLATRAAPDNSVNEVAFIARGQQGDVAKIVFFRDRMERSQALTGNPIALEGAARDWAPLNGAAKAEIAEAARDMSADKPAAPRAEPVEIPAAERDRIAKAVFEELETQNMRGVSLTLQGRQATLAVENNKYRHTANAVGRAARIVARHAPPQFESIAVTLVEDDLPATTVTLYRSDLERLEAKDGSPQEMWQHTRLETALDVPEENTTANPDRYPSVDWGLSPHIRQQVGGPNSFYFYQLYALGSASASVAPGLMVGGDIGRDLTNNFSGLTLASNSQLPHVRSDIVDYLKGADTWLDDLYVKYAARISGDLYGRVTAGYLEFMYAGVGGEMLYRPQDSLWAYGTELDWVRQRDFSGRFGLRDYSVPTGFFNVYRKFAQSNIVAVVRVGQYLARDRGVTLELQKEFDNGIRLGVFATKTNVSAQQFGEGSFDKGFSVSIPLDIFSGQPSRTRGYAGLHLLTRDGGQRVGVPGDLYETLRDVDGDSLGRSWREIAR